MTDEELEKKAREYSIVYGTKIGVIQHLRKKAYIDGFIEGAKAIQEDKERLKLALETNISNMKEIVELLQQFAKLKREIAK